MHPMFTPLKELVQRHDALVLPVMLVRQVGRLWHEVRQERQRSVEERRRLADQRHAVERYLAIGGRRKLQIGAGTNVLEGWLNADLEPSSPEVVFLDALQPFPLESESFDYVFSEHMIEHVTYPGGLHMLSEAFRVLKPRGRIRIATPDAERIARLLSSTKTDAERTYVRWTAEHQLGLYADEPSPLQQRRTEWALNPHHIRRHFPDAGDDCGCFVVNNFFRSYGHQFLYDERTLRAAMAEAGFVDVSRTDPGCSGVQELRGLEAHGRVIGFEANAFETMVLEAQRP